ncbi:division plane positioning ATPase MipZ [Telmatospirillum sp.]|uniref:division plane positioning ATPase MipZ n=1 Tax=Telmatospirillum sp. TaxID=2079197 RepID=UPI00283B7F71|nr:division plane positioning ATPase MipZ [Telmatospirillum sp.]MDR3436891.1 division plane positioning ATPase MipZ [Telmatospirillum sp.]
MKANSARVVVVGNEKGGTGKTTVAMHLAIGLLGRGMTVGVVDLDSRQQSLTRYLTNRRLWCGDHAISLPTPLHRLVLPSSDNSREVAEEEDRQALDDAVAAWNGQCEIVLLDCPAGDGSLSRAAHRLADVLVTPLNDSFLDLDPLLQFRPGSFQVLALGAYFEMLWEIRNQRHLAGESPFDWIVLRNRLSGLADQNKKNLSYVLSRIGPILRFRLAEGLGERIIFRQLFQQGLTLFDSSEPSTAILPTQSHLAARDELQALMDCLGEDNDMVMATDAAAGDGHM